MYNLPVAEGARVAKTRKLLKEMTLAKRPARKTLDEWCSEVKELSAILERAHREIINLKLDEYR